MSRSNSVRKLDHQCPFTHSSRFVGNHALLQRTVYDGNTTASLPRKRSNAASPDSFDLTIYRPQPGRVTRASCSATKVLLGLVRLRR
uniref:hypothetical protein n=1 Tax=Rhodococcus erythropolis TaxID=1833 RepID=UPI00117AF775|nr:hypothetical protein [Rhodococcus erythropolis]